jgi:hypothetical protein
LLKQEEGFFNKSASLKKQNSTTYSGVLTPREGNGAFKPKMAQPVVLVNDQSPKSNIRGTTPKGNMLESLINQVRNQLNGANGANTPTPNYRERMNSAISQTAGPSGIITPNSHFGVTQQSLNLSQIT